MPFVMPELSIRPKFAAAVLLALTLVMIPGGSKAQAQSAPSTDQPISFGAASVTHDRAAGTIVATGNVEAMQSGRILLADKVIYNQTTDILTATGNVSLTEPSGEVFFATSMVLSGDMKNGVIEDLRARLIDNSRLAANSAKRTNATVTTMNKAVYSPCELCPDDPTRPPLWQIKAAQVEHDANKKIIEYRNAWLELAGIPVLYTPYFHHPDPTVKRKTGFLTPSVQSSTDLGLVVKAPFYWDIAPNRGTTLTPITTGKAGNGMAIGYEELMRKGHVTFDGSLIYDDTETATSNSDIRWHVSTQAEVHLDQTWRTGLEVNRVSDDTYLRRYGFGSDPVQRSRLYAEGFRGRNYMVANAYDFQDLRDGAASDPLILPMLQYSHQSEAGRYGQTRTLDASFLSLTRNDASDIHRLSAEAGWHLPFLRPGGDIVTLSASLRGDAYYVNKDGVSSTDEDGFEGRVKPEASLHWRYPFVRSERNSYQLLEPMASFVVSPYGGNPSGIPNEDSTSLEFDDANIFNNNRFSGLDRIEGGPRINYGLRWGVYGNGGGSTTLMVGQSYRIRKDSTFDAGSGLEDNFSDIVGRLHVAPRGNVNFYYRTQINKDDLSARRHELQGNAGPETFNLSLDYSYFEDPPNSEYNGREQVSLTASSKFSKFWRASGSMLRDLTDEGGLRSLGLGLVYEDECFIFSTNATRSFFADRDLKPNDSITFTLSFKTLGDISSGPQTFGASQ